MKFWTSILLIASCAAFAPPASSPRRTAATTSTQLHMDLDALHHVVQAGTDAMKMLILDCDNQNECHMIDGWKDTGSGQWHFENRHGVVSPSFETSPDHTYKILMMEIDDVE